MRIGTGRCLRLRLPCSEKIFMRTTMTCLLKRPSGVTRQRRTVFHLEKKEMRRWWRDRDHIGLIPEKSIGAEVSLDEAVHMILSDMQAEK